jgi:hypothetical protein
VGEFGILVAPPGITRIRHTFLVFRESDVVSTQGSFLSNGESRIE